MYPNYNLAATESAIMGYGVLFQYIDPNGKHSVGIVWWQGETRHTRGLMWEE